MHAWTQFSGRVSKVCGRRGAQVFAFGTQSYSPFACPEDVVGEIVCSTQTVSSPSRC